MRTWTALLCLLSTVALADWPPPAQAAKVLEEALPNKPTLLMPLPAAHVTRWQPYVTALRDRGFTVIAESTATPKRVYRQIGAAPLPAILLLVPDSDFYDPTSIGVLLTVAYSRHIGVVGNDDTALRAGAMAIWECNTEPCSLRWNARVARSLGYSKE